MKKHTTVKEFRKLDIMELEQIIIDNPQLNKITEQMMNDITLDKLGVVLDYNKSLGENGFDVKR